MCNYDDMFKSICRLCLRQNNVEEMISLIDNSKVGDLSSFGQAVTIITNVLISKDDKLPFMACFKCVYLLKQTIYFKLKCESSDQKLKRLINFNEINGLSDQNIKRNICDYVMFSHYFPSKNCKYPIIKNKKIPNKINLDSEDHKITQIESKSNDMVDANTSDINVFDNFIENDDTTDNTLNDKSVAYPDEINNILDSIQYIINSESNVQTCKKRKLKRKQYTQPTIRNKDRNLICNICHKILANRLTYDHHMQRHNLCRFICDQCGKGFPVLAEMHMHQIARHGIGPYLKCDHCPYKAPRKINLIEHLRIHTGERPFTCEKCGLTFRRRAIWRNHLVRHMEKKHQCLHCPRKFYMHSQMLSHCNNVHERMYMYICQICSITYTKTETVRRHMTVKHGIPREKQGRIRRITTGSNEFNSKVN